VGLRIYAKTIDPSQSIQRIKPNTPLINPLKIKVNLYFSGST